MVVVSAARRRAKFGVSCVVAAGIAAPLLTGPGTAVAQTEPAACLSMNPQDWPTPSKPYFMIIVDTSISMGPISGSVSSANTCGIGNNYRLAHARCAVRNTVQAFAGQVNFGLASFAVRNTCSGTANPNDCDDDGVCSTQTAPGSGSGNSALCGPPITEPTIGTNGTTIRSGAHIIVPLLQDHYWSQPPAPSNVFDILELADNSCGNGNDELSASSSTPLGGSLFDMNRYFSGTYTDKWTGTTLPSPIGPSANERPCRSLNVILITDGDEQFCNENLNPQPTPIPGGCRDGQSSYINSNGEALASYEADRMWTQGINFDGRNYKVKTHVIAFAGANTTAANRIAACGGSGSAHSTSNETQLAAALSTIISGSILPETCNNVDDNCNGCTDEGFKHYCNRSRTPAASPTAMNQCCQWSNSTQRGNCLGAFEASITPSNPKGNQWLLPCWDPATDAAAPQTKWLCDDPGEHCDNNDNNCDVEVTTNQPGNNTRDETINKCGNPPQCPSAEVCDGRDNDCDNVVDDGVCGGCTVTPEVCDGCDNDCNGIADDNVPAEACGQASPANCVGQRACVPRGAVAPGGCVPGGGSFGACSNDPETEICNNLDDDCDGAIDDGIPPVACEVPGEPGLVYDDTFPLSFCKRGTQPCNGTCTGYRGPRDEICNGIDDDCDGIADNNLTGFGGSCQAQCGQGTYVCEGGVPFCRGTTAPQPEVCDGLDNDCNGVVDDGDTITDAPPTLGCWTNPDPGGTCGCSWEEASWCPPPNATCTGTGSLTAPCHIGTLICAGAAGWRCTNDQGPAQEVCDGSDNDCNGTVDDGVMTTSCGPTNNNPPCRPGVQICQAGVLVCDGAVFPGTELCNGMDDDCDTLIDEGVPVGDNCTAPYDMTLYPGPRNGVLCKPGTLICDPDGSGALLCQGGVGPQPEICDGLDNDCDGQIDEAGPAPDGIDGTADPDDPSLIIGETCGVTSGVCVPGRLACIDGDVRCTGGVGAQPEVCDCQDNDCDGLIDEDAEPGENPICGTGQTCVEVNAALCACAGPCSNSEFPCPIGRDCVETNRSATDELGRYCVSDPCGDCSTKTDTDQNGVVLCAPASSGLDVPECVCKGNAGCVNPCSGVSCPMGETCVLSGPEAGRCHDSGNCLFHGCPIEGQVCAGGECVDNPCKPDSCPADEVCKPNATFDGVRCVGSCAGVSCSPTERCVEGMCQPTGCDMACPDGQVCTADGDGGFTCGPGKCPEPLCSDGRSCDPATGQCNLPPCNGVICPTAQICVAGECQWEPEGGAGTGGTGGEGGEGGQAGAETGGSAPTAGTGGNQRPPDPRGVWGLATGGGGCSCRTTPSYPAPLRLAALVGLGAAALVLRRRRAAAATRRGAA